MQGDAAGSLSPATLAVKGMVDLFSGRCLGSMPQCKHQS